MRTRVGRTVGLLPSVAWKGWRVPAEDAVEAARDFGSNQAFEAVLQAASAPFRGGRGIEVPVTVAFGRRDFTLHRRNARFGDQLPDHTAWLDVPAAGHVPMWDNPAAVARLILERTR